MTSPCAGHAGTIFDSCSRTQITNLGGKSRKRVAAQYQSELTFTHSKIASVEQLQSIAPLIGCSHQLATKIPILTPLCKAHYHLINNALQPTQTHCNTCGLDLRKSMVRLCPDPQRIREYLADKTGFEGELPEGAKVCFTCYRSQSHMLKEAKSVSIKKCQQRRISSERPEKLRHERSV